MAQYRLSVYDGNYNPEKFIKFKYFEAVDDDQALDIAHCMYEESFKVWDNLFRFDANGKITIVYSLEEELEKIRKGIK